MNRKEIDELRGRNLTIGKFTFLFTRKPVKSSGDVVDRNTTISEIDHQLEQMEDAVKIAKVVKKTFAEDIGHYFRVRRERAHKESGDPMQLGLFEEGAVLEDQDGSRPKLLAKEPVEKPSKKKAAAGG